jgi:ABC-type sugar transport system ATPase subunit
MNFLNGALESAGGSLWFVHGALRLEIPGAAGRIGPQASVILGIRPHLTRLSAPGPAALPLTVYAIEQLGSEAIVICDGPAGEKIRTVVPAGYTAPVGARLDVCFDGAAAHLFDPASGRALVAEERV